MSLSMSKVSVCESVDCAYNANNECHTLAITVGNSTCPACDTYLKYDKKGGDPDTIGGVGACKTESCKFNKGFECSAGSIVVKLHGNHPDCKTFKT